MANKFLEFLEQIALKFDEQSAVFKLENDVGTFKRDFAKSLRKSSHTFTRYLSEWMSNVEETDMDPFVSLLNPLELVEHGSGVQLPFNPQMQTSLLKVMLNIDSIQPEILQICVERLLEYGSDSDSLSQNLSKQIINMLRWIEYVVDGPNLVQSIMDAIPCLSDINQKNLILAIPEIIPDSEQNEIISLLISLLDESPELLSPVLHTLSQLTLGQETLIKLKKLVIERLDSSELKDIPLMINYLANTCQPHDFCELIQEFRSRISFETIASIPETDQKSSHCLLIIEELRSSLCLHKNHAEGWIKAISNFKDKLLLIDILVLISLFSIGTGLKKRACLLFKTKAAAGLISDSIVNVAFDKLDGFSREFENDIISLVGWLLNAAPNSDSSISTSTSFLIGLFNNSDCFRRQEIINLLVSPIGNGSVDEIDACLKTLSSIVSCVSVTDMMSFTKILKSMLDYVEFLTVNQVDQVFKIITRLNFSSGSTSSEIVDGGLMNELFIMVKKQLSHNSDNYKIIGIYGAIALLECLCGTKKEEDDIPEISMSQRIAGDPGLKTAVSLINNVLRQTKDNLRCLILFYKELAASVSRGLLSKSFISWIHENFGVEFQENYLEEPSGLSNESLGIPENFPKIRLQDSLLDLDPVALKIYPSCFHRFSPVEESPSIEQCCSKTCNLKLSLSRIHVLPSSFNLMQVCEKADNFGLLDGIDVLLGCGIIMDEKQEFDSKKLETCEENEGDSYTKYVEEVRILSMFYKIEWLRLLLNAFFNQKHDQDMMKKVFLRLKDLVTAEEEFNAAMSNFSAIRIMQHLPSSKDLILYRSGISSNTESSHEEVAGSDVSEDEADAPISKDSVIALSESSFRSPGFDTVKRYLSDLDLDVLILLNSTSELTQNLMRQPEKRYLLNFLVKKTECLYSSFYHSPLMIAKRKKDPFHQSNISGPIERRSIKEISHILVKSIFPGAFSVLLSMIDDMKQSNRTIELQKKFKIELDCCGDVISSLTYFLSWEGWSSEENRSLLCDLLNIISNSSSESKSLESVVPSLSSFWKSKFSDLPTVEISFKTLKMVNQLKDTIMNLHYINCSRFGIHFKEIVGELAAKILEKEWEDKYFLNGDKLAFVLYQEIINSPKPYGLLAKYIRRGIPALLDETESVLVNYPFLTNETLHIYYKVLLTLVTECMSNDVISSGSINDIENYISLFTDLIGFIKAVDRKSLLHQALKHGKNFVESFSKICIPLLNASFVENAKKVTLMLKDFQSATRILQQICNHSKEYRDVKLTSLVPSVKKSLEAFIYSVKGMLADHDSLSAFWVGNLRHKKLREVVSENQSPSDANLNKKSFLNNVDQNNTITSSQKKRKISHKQIPSTLGNISEEQNISATYVNDTDDELSDLVSSSSKDSVSSQVSNKSQLAASSSCKKKFSSSSSSSEVIYDRSDSLEF